MILDPPPRRSIVRTAVMTLCALLLVGVWSGCAEEEIIYEGLHLWITSDEPASQDRIDRLVITVSNLDDDGVPHRFEGQSASDHQKEIVLSEAYNIYESPYKAKLLPGDVIQGYVQMTVEGFHDQTLLSDWTGNVSLDGDYKFDIHLTLISEPDKPCEDGTHDCDPNADCWPGEEGVYTCTCDEGYVGSGTTCEPFVCEEDQTESCGNCGTHTCASNAWKACENVGVCAEGDKKACGNGGSQVCLDTCMWDECMGQGPCESGATQPCGNCGSQTCGADNEWQACGDQGVCASGQSQSQKCGQCGSQSRLCTDQCAWADWADCGGQGSCTPDETENQDCGNCGSQTRTCTNQCQWAAFGPCGNQGSCAPGATASQDCGNCGTQSKTCTDQCQWSGFGNCTGQGSCKPGDILSCGGGDSCGSQFCKTNCQWDNCEPNNSQCDDTNPCTTDVCALTPVGQCVNTNVANGTNCGIGMHCQNGLCTEMECTFNNDCEDSNPCTVNKCDGGFCVDTFASETTPCDDGLGCTIPDQCVFGLCVSGPVLLGNCLIDNQCYSAKESFGIGCSECDPKTSQTTPTPLNSGNQCIPCQGWGHCNTDGGCSSSLDCDDGDSGTTNDACDNGVCIGELAQTCKAIKDNDPSAPTGTYTIDPDQGGPGLPFPVHCAMISKGGGWIQFGDIDHPINNFLGSKHIGTFNQGTIGNVGYSLNIDQFYALTGSKFDLLIHYGDNNVKAFEHTGYTKPSNGNFLVPATNKKGTGEHGLFGTNKVNNYYAAFCAVVGGCGENGNDYFNFSTAGDYPKNYSKIQCGFYGYQNHGWKNCTGSDNHHRMRYFFREQ